MKKQSTFQPAKAATTSGSQFGSQGGAANPGAGYLNQNAKTVGQAVTKGTGADAGKYAASGRGVFDKQLIGRK
jgi:hypothetical protein